jgi:asparagine synthase (glutamine-hydrolysing)
MYNLVLRLGTDNVFEPAFLQQVDITKGARQQREVWQQAQAESLINRMLAFDWRFTLAENDLPKVCNTAELAGVAVGFPLLDDRLLEFSLRLPPEFKLKGLKLRWFFKEALRGFLPDEIINKKKHGFGLPFGIWAMAHAELKRLAKESLRSFASRGVIKSDFIENLLSEQLPSHPGYYGEMVWLIMMMEQWLRRHAPDYQLNG